MRDTFFMCLELCLVFVSPFIAALYLICNEEFSCTHKRERERERERARERKRMVEPSTDTHTGSFKVWVTIKIMCQHVYSWNQDKKLSIHIQANQQNSGSTDNVSACI